MFTLIRESRRLFEKAVRPFELAVARVRLADGGDDVGYIIAEVDPAKVQEARQMVPALRHDRAFSKPELVSEQAAE